MQIPCLAPTILWDLVFACLPHLILDHSAPGFLNPRRLVLAVPGTHPLFPDVGHLHKSTAVWIILVLPRPQNLATFCRSDFSWNITSLERSSLIILYKIGPSAYICLQHRFVPFIYCPFFWSFVNVSYLFTCLFSVSPNRPALSKSQYICLQWKTEKVS